MKTTTTQVLKNIYFKPSHPAGFGSVQQLYQEAKKIIPSITKNKVSKWLHSQTAYTLHKPFKTKYKRRKTLARGLHNIWQADLADFKAIAQENANFKYLLCVEDILSRFVWVRCLKNKSALEVLKAFKDILETTKLKPQKLHTDEGTEFWNIHFRKYLRDNDIIHYSTRSETKASLIERWIRTLKRRLFMYFSHKLTLKYYDCIQDFVSSYNNRPHRSLKYAKPIDVNKQNELEYWKLQFSDRSQKITPFVLSAKKSKHNPDVKIYRIKKYDGKEIVQPIQRGKPRFDINQRVRLLRFNTKFRKGYIQTFTSQVYRIKEVLDTFPYTYSVFHEESGEPVEGIFYKEELIAIENE